MTLNAVILSVLFGISLAFQQNTHSKSNHHGNFRHSTVCKVLTNPNSNLVRIEKNPIVDRTALEELFMRSSSAPENKRQVKVGSTTKKKRKRDSIIYNKTKENKSSSITGRNKKSTLTSECGPQHSIEITRDRKIDEQHREEIVMQQQIKFGRSDDSSKVLFKGLTTGPVYSKLRGKKVKTKSRSEKTKAKLNINHATSGSTIAYDEDEHIRRILRRKEESFKCDHPSTTALSSLMTELSLSSAAVTKDTKALTRHNESRFSRSSTMPGFKERTNTNRANAYRDGIKLAEQRSGEKIIDSAAAKKKRAEASGREMYKTSDSVPKSLQQFANEIHHVDRITSQEEISLGEKTQEAIRLQNIYDRLVENLEREPTDDEWCAAAGKFNMESLSQTIEDGLEAKNRLVTSNLRMVQGVVNVYIRNGLKGQYNAGDLMQEGILSLIRAAEKFDPSRGFKFSTYAMYWIRSGIKKDQLLQSRVVPIPQRLHENYKKIRKVGQELKVSLNRPPTQKELSDAVGLSEAIIERCETAVTQKYYSLDQQMVNRRRSNTGKKSDTIQSILQVKTDNTVIDHDYMFLHGDLMNAITLNLSKEVANVIVLRFGMDTDRFVSKRGGRTISEVSEIVGLKPDKVRRTINKGLKELQLILADDFESYRRGLN